MASRVRVVVADDAKGVRDLLSVVLALEDDLEVVGEASDGNQAVDVVRQRQPDVLVLDVSMPHADGLSVIDDVRAAAPDTKVIVYTGHDDDDVRREAAQGGAVVVTKDGQLDDLVRQIRLLFFGR